MKKIYESLTEPSPLIYAYLLPCILLIASHSKIHLMKWTSLIIIGFIAYYAICLQNNLSNSKIIPIYNKYISKWFAILLVTLLFIMAMFFGLFYCHLATILIICDIFLLVCGTLLCSIYNSRRILLLAALAILPLIVFAETEESLSLVAWLSFAACLSWEISSYYCLNLQFGFNSIENFLKFTVSSLVFSILLIPLGIFAGLSVIYYLCVLITIMIYFYIYYRINYSKFDVATLVYRYHVIVSIILFFGVVLN